MEPTDGMVKPKDVEENLFGEGGDDRDGDASSCASDDEMRDYEGEPLSSGDECDEPLPKEMESLPPPSAPSAGGHGTPSQARFKQYHLSPEWIALREKGEHLVNIPPVTGCGVNRHPAKSFWSCRFPGQADKTASWSDNRSAGRCLILCLKHVIKVYLETMHPANADQWNAQLHELSQVVL